jgi:hypothetical protein
LSSECARGSDLAVPSPARYTGYYRQNRPNRYSVFLAGSGGISGYLGAG